MTDLKQSAQAVLDAWDSPLWKTGTTAAKIADLRAALEQQAEPVAWDKPSASFNAWWDSDYHDPANPFAEGSAAYWAWAGWKSAQRQWQGLTDEEVNRESAPIAQQMKLAFHAGMYVAQKILKERNHD